MQGEEKQVGEERNPYIAKPTVTNLFATPKQQPPMEREVTHDQNGRTISFGSLDNNNDPKVITSYQREPMRQVIKRIAADGTVSYTNEEQQGIPASTRTIVGQPVVRHIQNPQGGYIQSPATTRVIQQMPAVVKNQGLVTTRIQQAPLVAPQLQTPMTTRVQNGPLISQMHSPMVVQLQTPRQGYVPQHRAPSSPQSRTSDLLSMPHELVSNMPVSNSGSKQTTLSNGEVITHTNPIIERKIIYFDEDTGKKMMRVCTPRGTIKRIECLEAAPAENPIEMIVRDVSVDFGHARAEPFTVGLGNSNIGPVKVESGGPDSGKMVVYGGDGIGAVERGYGWLVDEGLVNRRICSTIKKVGRGDIIVNDFESGWDLVLLDQEFNEIERLEGLGDPVPPYRHLIRTRVGEDDRYMCWLRGESEVSIVNIEEFSARHINNFWMFAGKPVKAVCVGVDVFATKLCGIGFLPNSGELQTIHVYDGGDDVSVFEATEMLPEVEAWLCLEISNDSDVFFLGGAQSKDFERHGDAFIAAMTFDDDPRLINFARYGNDVGFGAINCLRRHPDGDILFAGCVGAIAVILWAGGQFHLIKIYNNSVDLPVMDLCFADDVLYAVSDHKEALALHFTDRTMRQKDKRGPPPPHGQFKNKPLGRVQLSLADRYRSRQRIPPVHGKDFRDYTYQQIGVSGVEMKRIQVTPDESLIYVGNNVLKVLGQEPNGSVTLLDEGAHIKRFIDLKVLKATGEVILFDEQTSDLIKYDPRLNESKRLKGRRAISLEGAEIVTTLYNGDNLVYIWMLGDGSIGLVDPSTMEYDIIENFFGDINRNVTPFTAVASIKQRKVLGLYIEDNLIYFVFLRGQNPLLRKLQSDILGESKNLR